MSSGFDNGTKKRKRKRVATIQRSSSWFNNMMFCLFYHGIYQLLKKELMNQMPKKIMGMGYQQRF
jgi:hypothetical protein